MYFVIFKLDGNKKIRVGKLGEIEFREGYYVYVGSAKKGFSKRVKRHFSKDKKLHWHVDYLSIEARALEAFRCRADEHTLAELAGRFMEGIKGFGSSDCKCYSHLFYSPEYPGECIEEAKKLNYILAERLDHEEL